MGQSRYIKMTGDPVAVKEPLRQTFYRANDFSALLGAAGMSYIVNPEQITGPGHIVGLGGVLVNGVFNMVAFRWLDRWCMVMDGLDGKCIDTRPDKDTPPTTGKYGLKAHSLRNFYGMMLLLGGVLDLGQVFSRTAARHEPLGVALINTALTGVVYYTRMAGGYRRFHKVMKGEWQIVDMPTPEKLAEAAREEHEKPAPVRQPTPV